MDNGRSYNIMVQASAPQTSSVLQAEAKALAFRNKTFRAAEH
jgi:hypothetical protein